MTEPALVALAHGSRDHRSARTVQAIVATTRRLRPELAVEAAFLDHNGPDLASVVERLADAGHLEIVVVPLFLTAGYHARVDSPAAVASVQARYPAAVVRLADVVGTDTALLSAVDTRLCESLTAERTSPPDALVLASAGTSDPEARVAVSALAQEWGRRRSLPVSVAFASTATPSATDAVRRWTQAGFRRVAVGSLFIAPGTLPDRVRALAFRAGAIAVAEPLGPHAQLGRVLVDRYLASVLTLGVLV